MFVNKELADEITQKRNKIAEAKHYEPFNRIYRLHEKAAQSDASTNSYVLESPEDAKKIITDKEEILKNGRAIFQALAWGTKQIHHLFQVNEGLDLEFICNLAGRVDPDYYGTKPAQLRTGWVRPTGAPYTPPAPEKLPKKMEEFLRHVNNFMNMAKADQANEHYGRVLDVAGYAHYALTRIHPLDDANGRTSRVLQNSILKYFGLPPAIIWSGEKIDYIRHLRAADEGHHKLERPEEEKTGKMLISEGEKAFFDYLATRVNISLDRILDQDFNIDAFQEK